MFVKYEKEIRISKLKRCETARAHRSSLITEIRILTLFIEHKKTHKIKQKKPLKF